MKKTLIFFSLAASLISSTSLYAADHPNIKSCTIEGKQNHCIINDFKPGSDTARVDFDNFVLTTPNDKRIICDFNSKTVESEGHIEGTTGDIGEATVDQATHGRIVADIVPNGKAEITGNVDFTVMNISPTDGSITVTNCKSYSNLSTLG